MSYYRRNFFNCDIAILILNNCSCQSRTCIKQCLFQAVKTTIHISDAVLIFYHHLVKTNVVGQRTAIAYFLEFAHRSTIALFSNNKQFLLDLAHKLKTPTVQFWEPNPNYIDILKSNTKIQIVDEPPKLPLKIWFNSTRINTDFANWLRANDDKCKIGKVALESLENYGYLNGLYIYLRDEKILNLVTMLAGSSIRSVEKLVYRGDIDKY